MNHNQPVAATHIWLCARRFPLDSNAANTSVERKHTNLFPSIYQSPSKTFPNDASARYPRLKPSASSHTDKKLTKIIYDANQKIRIDILGTFIRDAKIIRAKNSE